MSRRLLVALAVAGFVLVALAEVLVRVAHDFQPDPGEGRGLVVYAGVWMSRAWYAYRRREPVGLLMVALGFAVARRLCWDASLPYTVFTALRNLELVLTVHLFSRSSPQSARDGPRTAVGRRRVLRLARPGATGVLMWDPRRTTGAGSDDPFHSMVAPGHRCASFQRHGCLVIESLWSPGSCSAEGASAREQRVVRSPRALTSAPNAILLFVPT
jgi:hypothetical protein